MGCTMSPPWISGCSWTLGPFGSGQLSLLPSSPTRVSWAVGAVFQFTIQSDCRLASQVIAASASLVSANTPAIGPGAPKPAAR